MQNRHALYVAEDRDKGKTKRASSTRQWIVLGIMVLVMVGNAGCNTFIQQTADVMEGGPRKRIEEAQQRQEEAVDTQMNLRQNQRELEQQLASEERNIEKMRGRLHEQTARITRARESNRISVAEEERLKRSVAALDNEIQSLELKIQVHKVSAGSAEDTSQLRQKLEALRAEEKRIDEELKTLEQ